MVVKVRETPSVSKSAAQRFDMDGLDLNTVN
jgi:hypothetical protein